MATWRYLAFRVHGDGTETPLGEIDLIEEPSITDVLSGPPRMRASIAPAVKELKDATGAPLFVPWNTALYPVTPDNDINSGFLLVGSTFNGDTWDLDCAGFTYYPKGQPYTGAQYWVQVDPADMHRHIWAHLQGLPGGNLGVIVDSTTTPVRIGKELEEVTFTTGRGEVVNFEAGPYKLNWYQSHDLGKEIDDLATETPYDWHEEHSWNGESVRHFVRLVYPRMGRRRTDQWLAIGENVAVEPSVTQDGEDYASLIIALGAGEGAEMIRGESAGTPQGVRRAVVIEDKSLKSKASANGAAAREAAGRRDLLDVTEVQVWDHPNLPLHEAQLGDELRLYGNTGWIDINMWVRIVSITRRPDTDDTMTLTVERADRGMT